MSTMIPILILIAILTSCLYCCFPRRSTKARASEDLQQTPNQLRHDLEGYHRIGFCTRCKQQTRLSDHCDGCGGHDRWNIKPHVIKDGVKDYVCTTCFHLARYAHHCDVCGGGSKIVAVS